MNETKGADRKVSARFSHSGGTEIMRDLILEKFDNTYAISS